DDAVHIAVQHLQLGVQAHLDAETINPSAAQQRRLTPHRFAAPVDVLRKPWILPEVGSFRGRVPERVRDHGSRSEATTDLHQLELNPECERDVARADRDAELAT